MKTKEEVLKIYNAYLPYKLEILTQEYSDSKILSGVSFYDDSLYFDQDDRWCDVTEAKPYLHEMDMLTKEIEHKGESFIPIEKLFDIESGLKWSKSGYIKPEKGKDEYWVRQKEDGRSFHFGYNAEKNYFYKIDSENCKQSVWKQLELFQKLFEWHFNIFGLDESEYIKKESVIQK